MVDDFFSAQGSHSTECAKLIYEDLVRDAEAQLRTVCDFIGVRYEEPMAMPYSSAAAVDKSRMAYKCRRL